MRPIKVKVIQIQLVILCTLSKEMDYPDHFEEIVKMHCFPLMSTKYGSVNVSGSIKKDLDFEESYDGNQFESNSFRPEFESNPLNLQFFKDPFKIPDEQCMDENTYDLRPGRSMRACKSVSSQRKDMPDVMNKRKYLLQKQREEKLKFEKEENSSQIATAFINGLINEGFQIEPPIQTPRFGNLTSPSPQFKDVRDIEEKMLFVDCYKELKRVQVSES